jgi:iron complex transport system substrate-binding protein
MALGKEVMRRTAHGLRPAASLVVTCGSLLATAVCCLTIALTAQSQPSSRIVSLVPALTDMLLAIGAQPQIVAVSSFDEDPRVKSLPRVGALLDPDVERILALKPTMVLLYGSQTDLMAQLKRAGIAYFDYRHGGLAHVTNTIRSLGDLVGRSSEARELAGKIERTIDGIRRATSGRPKPRTLLVFERDRGSLRNIYASGGRGFLHEMLEAAGGVNVFADVNAESLQATTEMILGRPPDVIIELRSTDIPPAAGIAADLAVWKALASVPAVKNGRTHLLIGKTISVPGPTVAEGTARLARLLHPDVTLPTFAQPAPGRASVDKPRGR